MRRDASAAVSSIIQLRMAVSRPPSVSNLAYCVMRLLPGRGRGSRRGPRPARPPARARLASRGGERRAGLVGAQGVLDVDDVRGGGYVLEVAELGDQLDVVERLGELAAEAL